MKRRAKATPRRPEQVAEQIRQILSEMLVHGEIRDPRVTGGTVTSVKIGKDLSTARVWLALPGTTDEQAKSLEGLRSAAGYIRSRVAQELTTYKAPEFRFEKDDGAERGAQVDAILAEIKRAEFEGARGAEGAQEGDGAHDQADGADGHE